MKILVLEPYHGASHKRFLDDLSEHLPFDFVRLTQPARAWKWRMRFAAPYFAECLRGSRDKFDVIFSSTFLSLADFRGLAPMSIGRLPAAVYWHENQWAYPVRKEDERDRHFVITNFTTALAADINLFNSEWNRSSLMAGLRKILKEIPDTNIDRALQEIRAKSEVLWPPIMDTGLPGETKTEDSGRSKIPRILWNHRWEHDKNPEEFFQALFALKAADVPFELIVAGQSFANQPAIFAEAKDKLSDRLIHWGFVEQSHDYQKILATTDYVVSTAHHEFFGLSVMEAALAGATPVVPAHLSYPEIYPKSCQYEPGALAPFLRQILTGEKTLPNSLAATLGQHRWRTQKPNWEQMFQRLAGMTQNRD